MCEPGSFDRAWGGVVGGHRRPAEATVGSVFSHGIWEQGDKTAAPPPRGLDEKEPPPQEPKMSGRGEHARDQSGRQASY